MVLKLFLLVILALAAWATPTCYDPSQPGVKAYKINVLDCADVLERMLQGNNVTQPSLWSSSLGSHSKAWYSNTCALSTYLNNGHTSTMASYASVAETAVEIMRACVGKPNSANIGGQDTVADDPDLVVTMTGKGGKSR